MSMDGVDGVNVRRWWVPEAKAERPTVDANAAKREVLIVDRRGQPLVVREPRPVGFRPR